MASFEAVVAANRICVERNTSDTGRSARHPLTAGKPGQIFEKAGPGIVSRMAGYVYSSKRRPDKLQFRLLSFSNSPDED